MPAAKGDDVSSDDARAAVAEAYRAHYRRLVAAIYAATGDYAEAQDVVQEAYARALDRPRQFLSVADPQAWLRVVALNFARQRWRRRRIFDRLIRLGRVTQPADTVPGLGGERVDLARALLRLSRPTREAIVLHHLLDLPVSAVAEELGVPVGTVKARLARGRSQLSGYLDRDPGGSDTPARALPGGATTAVAPGLGTAITAATNVVNG
jgi:RNA polymerase sigma-70 factor (ECF subfamily)